MTVLFYFFWLWAFARILSTPFLRLGLKLFFGLTILLGGWVLIGVCVYQAQATRHVAEKLVFETQNAARVAQQEKIARLLDAHPSSRDLLLLQVQAAFYGGDQNSFHKHLEQLKEIDPNNQDLKRFKDVIFRK